MSKRRTRNLRYERPHLSEIGKVIGTLQPILHLDRRARIHEDLTTLYDVTRRLRACMTVTSGTNQDRVEPQSVRRELHRVTRSPLIHRKAQINDLWINRACAVTLVTVILCGLEGDPEEEKIAAAGTVTMKGDTAEILSTS